MHLPEQIKKFGLELIQNDDIPTLKITSVPAIYIQCFPEQPKYFVYKEFCNGGHCSSSKGAIMVIKDLLTQVWTH